MSSQGQSPVVLPDAQQSFQFALWRNTALERMPYLSPIMYRFKLVSAPGLGTMACDRGLRLYIDFDAVAAHGDVFAAEGLMHECLHVLSYHFERHHQVSNRVGATALSSARIWNLAADASINDDLVYAGCSTLGDHGVLPMHFQQDDGLSAEHYFKVLFDQAEKTGQGQGGQGDQQNQSQPGQGQGGQQSGDDQSGPDDQQPYTGCGSISGGEPAPCEIPDDGGYLGDQAAAASADDIDIAIHDTAEQVKEHAKSRGNVPSGILDTCDIITAPPVTDWRTLVRARNSRILGSGRRTKSTYTRTSRRRRHVYLNGKRVVFPGKIHLSQLVVAIRDTSGSMSDDDLGRVSGEIINIHNRLGCSGEALQVIDVDADAYDPVPFTTPGRLRSVKGRGGTDMRLGFDKIAELGLNPDLVVVLTDMGTPWPEVFEWPTTIVGVGDYLPDTFDLADQHRNVTYVKVND